MNYRSKANITLAVVLLVFILFALLKHLYPEQQAIRFFFFVSEASLVGGIADWFAVTALFRKPLGWPYHTALIPRNRAKMVEGVVRLVEKELLSERMLQEKIGKLSPSAWLIGTIDGAGGDSLLTQKLDQGLRQILKDANGSGAKSEAELGSDEERTKDHDGPKQRGDKGRASFTETLVSKLKERLASTLYKTDLVSPALEKTQEIMAGQTFSRGVDKLLDWAIQEASRPMVRALLHQALEKIQQEKVSQSSTLEKALFGILQVSNTINLEEAAEALQTELILYLTEIRERPEHPVREQLKDALIRRLAEWQRTPSTAETLSHWKNHLISTVNLEPIVAALVNHLASSLGEGRLPSRTPLAEALQPVLRKWWLHFKKDAPLQDSLDQVIQDFLLGALKQEHSLIGQIVRETLESLSEEELNAFIEDKAGDDLQWIRMNGSLVGGLVGAVLFLLLNYGYAPLLAALR